MATIKYKDENGEWKELTILKGDSGVAPIINKDTNTWLVWDDVEGAYIDSGVVAGVGTQDFVDSTYWVFNEITSGKKVIADALTKRNYPTDKSESFNDMAQKITDMSYGLGVFEKIGYTEEPMSAIAEMVDYSYGLAKGWNPYEDTSQMFKDNKYLIFPPKVDITNYTSLANMYKNCLSIIFIPNYDYSNKESLANFAMGSGVTQIGDVNAIGATSLNYAFGGCSRLQRVGRIDSPKATNMGYLFYQCSLLRYIEQIDFYSALSLNGIFTSCSALQHMKIINLGKSSLSTYDFSGASNWGTGSEENRQSLIDSLITYSYDRASNGMATATIQLSANTKALLTDDEIAQITAKGFTIS